MAGRSRLVKLNEIIFIFILTYHRLPEIKLFVVAGSFTGCVFMPQVFLHHEFRCVTRRDWRKKKTGGFAVRLESSADVLVCGFTGLSGPVLNWRLAAVAPEQRFGAPRRRKSHQNQSRLVGRMPALPGRAASFGHSMARSAGDNVIDPDEKKRFPVPGQIYGSAETHAG